MPYLNREFAAFTLQGKDLNPCRRSVITNPVGPLLAWARLNRLSPVRLKRHCDLLPRKSVVPVLFRRQSHVSRCRLNLRIVLPRGGRNRHDLRGAPRAADRKLTSTETAVSEQRTLLLFSEADCTDIPAVTGVVQPGMDTLVSKVTAQSATLGR